MRSLVSRLKRLEQIERKVARPRFVIHSGYLKTLPSDYVGPRHQITVRQIPQEELPPSSLRAGWVSTYRLSHFPGLVKRRRLP